MAKLISDSEFAEIRTVINDVSETFLQKTVTYKLKTVSMDRMNRDRNEKGSFQDVNLDVLVVWDETEVETDRTNGVMDLSDGYLLVNWDYLETTPLLDSGVLKTNIGADRVIVDDKELILIGIEKLGQLKDTFTVLKFYIKKQLKNKS